jgi:hypothetical protein
MPLQFDRKANNALFTCSVEGHRIALSDWELLIAAIEKLHSDLDRIEFMWSQEDEEALSPRSNTTR